MSIGDPMTMTPDEALKVVRQPVVVGKSYEFYAEMQEEYEPPTERMRRFTGTAVTVTAKEPTSEDGGQLYRVRAHDGSEFFAQEEELNGWDRDLGQFFWPNATYGPNHDTTFLVNEHE